MTSITKEKTESRILRLQRIRKNLKRKRPNFRRVESWRYTRVPERWRRARGFDSKTREKKGGWPISPKIGFRSPKDVRYTLPSGKEEVLINSIVDLALIDSKRQSGRISAKVGRKKKEKIITEAELLNIYIVNPISAKIDLGDLDKELEIDEELLDDLAIEDLDISDDEDQGEEE
jgi:large subunit ribosomal protein L32e